MAPMERSVGLRERKKEATRQAVHEAALRLTVEHGFDQVTVEAVADAAGISRRTFSNYFTGKEDALLYGEEQQIGDLVRAVRERPAEESAWTALRAAVAPFAERLAPRNANGPSAPDWPCATPPCSPASSPTTQHWNATWPKR